MWFHGTAAHEEIIKNGFSLDFIKNGRRFGNGVYFSDKMDVDYYGSNIIKANIDHSNVLEVSINDINRILDRLIMRYGNDYNNHVGAYIKDMGYDAISIEYDGRNKELVVYNLNIISIVQ